MKCPLCEESMYAVQGVWACSSCGNKVKHEVVIDLDKLGITGEAAEEFRKASAKLCSIFEKYFPSK